MTKTPLFAAAFLAYPATGAHAQMSHAPTADAPMPQLPAMQGMQTPYIQSLAPPSAIRASAPFLWRPNRYGTAQPAAARSAANPGLHGSLHDRPPGTLGMAGGRPCGMTK